MAVNPAYVALTPANMFQDWFDRTNALASDLSLITLTTDTTTAGASVTGNSSLKGNFDCFTLSVGTGIRGGTNSLSAPLKLLSNTTAQGDFTVQGAAVFTGATVTASATTTTILNGTTNIFGPSLNVTAPTNFANTVVATLFDGVATEAVKLETPRTITLAGDVVGTATFDGTADITITATKTDPGGYIPTGGIIMWSGSVVPAGWALCDGLNGTPNLTDRFIVGAGAAYAIGATGGVDSVTLTTNQIPGHAHTITGTTNTAGSHTHTLQLRATRRSAAVSDVAVVTNNTNLTNTSDSAITTMSGENIARAAGDNTHTFSGTTSSLGGGASHENRPPYYALAFIMKV